MYKAGAHFFKGEKLTGGWEVPVRGYWMKIWESVNAPLSTLVHDRTNKAVVGAAGLPHGALISDYTVIGRETAKKRRSSMSGRESETPRSNCTGDFRRSRSSSRIGHLSLRLPKGTKHIHLATPPFVVHLVRFPNAPPIHASPWSLPDPMTRRSGLKTLQNPIKQSFFIALLTHKHLLRVS